MNQVGCRLDNGKVRRGSRTNCESINTESVADSLFGVRDIQKGEKLLVVSEQAVGDVIFHMRYLLPLRQQGIDLSFSAPEIK